MSDLGSSLAQTILNRYGSIDLAIADCEVKLKEFRASGDDHAITQFDSALAELKRVAAAEEKGRVMRG